MIVFLPTDGVMLLLLVLLLIDNLPLEDLILRLGHYMCRGYFRTFRLLKCFFYFPKLLF